MALEKQSHEPGPDGARRSCGGHRDPGQSARPYPVLCLPMFCERAFCPFDVLCAWLTILFGQIAQQCPQGLAFFMFRQDLGNVTRHGIRSSGTHFPVDPGELMRGQTDGDLRPGHTSIIPRVRKYRKAGAAAASAEVFVTRHVDIDFTKVVASCYSVRARMLLVLSSLSPRSRDHRCPRFVRVADDTPGDGKRYAVTQGDLA